jgi:hypothetical protein
VFVQVESFDAAQERRFTIYHLTLFDISHFSFRRAAKAKCVIGKTGRALNQIELLEKKNAVKTVSLLTAGNDK